MSELIDGSYTHVKIISPSGSNGHHTGETPLAEPYETVYQLTSDIQYTPDASRQSHLLFMRYGEDVFIAPELAGSIPDKRKVIHPPSSEIKEDQSPSKRPSQENISRQKAMREAGIPRVSARSLARRGISLHEIPFLSDEELQNGELTPQSVRNIRAALR